MKYIKILLLLLLFISCNHKARVQIEPIDKYKNKGVVVLQEPYLRDSWPIFAVKNKDSVFYIQVSNYEATYLKPGDTIK